MSKPEGVSDADYQKWKGELLAGDATEAEADAAIAGGYRGAASTGAGGVTSPLDKFKSQIDGDFRNIFGPGVTDQLKATLAPQFALLAGEDDARQQAAIDQIMPAIAAQYLPQAVQADYDVRHKAFKDYWRQTFTLPSQMGAGPTVTGQARATQAGLDAQELASEADYESYYQTGASRQAGSSLPAGMAGPPLLGPHLSTELGIMNYIAHAGDTTLQTARPDLSESDPIYLQGKAAIRFNIGLATKAAQQTAQAQTALTKARDRQATHLNDLTRDPSIDPDTRAKFSAIVDSLYDPNLASDFVNASQQAAVSGVPLSADAYVGSLTGPDLQAALQGTDLAKSLALDSTGAVDVVGTVGNIKANQKALQKSQAQAVAGVQGIAATGQPQGETARESQALFPTAPSGAGYNVKTLKPTLDQLQAGSLQFNPDVAKQIAQGHNLYGQVYKAGQTDRLTGQDLGARGQQVIDEEYQKSAGDLNAYQRNVNNRIVKEAFQQGHPITPYDTATALAQQRGLVDVEGNTDPGAIIKEWSTPTKAATPSGG